jgi:hypothetical protein
VVRKSKATMTVVVMPHLSSVPRHLLSPSQLFKNFAS